MILGNRRKSVIGILQFACLFLFCSNCKHKPKVPETKLAAFETTPERIPLTPGIIDESSGIARANNHTQHLWTIQDSGNPNALYLVSGRDASVKEYDLTKSRNNDWEDIASGPGPQSEVNYLYVADIGNNTLAPKLSSTIYRVPEIKNLEDGFSNESTEQIKFSYPDGARDAETLLLDPKTKDLFIVSKETGSTGLYRLAYPQLVGQVIESVKVGQIPGIALVTGGDISPDGDEILLRTYLGVYYWHKKKDESVSQALLRNADKQFIVTPEPQGEGICFDSGASGFYTLSERANAASVTLNYFKRK